MRNLKLYLDSKLKDMKLFKVAQDIIMNSYDIDTDDTIPNKLYATDLFSDFIELAKMSSNYENWGEKEWNNYVMLMSLAFKEKGRSTALSCALTAIPGLTLVPNSVSIQDEYVTEGNVTKYMTVVRFEIQYIDTPYTTKFLEKLKLVLPKLFWVHELKVPNDITLFDTVKTKIYIDKQYNKNIYSRTCNYVDLTSESPANINLPNNWNV